jgi:hypothetical protein
MNTAHQCQKRRPTKANSLDEQAGALGAHPVGQEDSIDTSREKAPHGMSGLSARCAAAADSFGLEAGWPRLTGGSSDRVAGLRAGEGNSFHLTGRSRDGVAKSFYLTGESPRREVNSFRRAGGSFRRAVNSFYLTGESLRRAVLALSQAFEGFSGHFPAPGPWFHPSRPSPAYAPALLGRHESALGPAGPALPMGRRQSVFSGWHRLRPRAGRPRFCALRPAA